MLSIGICVCAYSALGISRMILNYVKIKTAKCPSYSIDDIRITEEKNIEALELYSQTKNSPIYVGSPNAHFPIGDEPVDNMLGSCGKIDNFKFKNYWYINNPQYKVFITNITHHIYKDLLKNHDQDKHLEKLIMYNADKKLFLNHIKVDKAFVLKDKDIGIYHESQNYLAFKYSMMTRQPLTFLSGIVGTIVIMCNV
jgi:hypothetical protein